MTSAPKHPDENASPTYGAMSDVMCDHSYIPAASAKIYTSPCIVARTTTPFDVIIALTACKNEITLQNGDLFVSGSALISPVQQRGMYAEGVKLVLMQLDPRHPAYRLFRNLRSIQKLNREDFSEFDESLLAAYEGRLSLSESQALFNGVIAKVLKDLPSLPPLDSRVQSAMHLLHENPRLSVETLATQSELSYDRMSHLFMDELGISIRSFQVWVKLHRALRGIRHGQSLVELAQLAGFSDAAHLSRVFKQAYGAPPSYFYYSGNVKLVASCFGEIPPARTADDPALPRRPTVTLPVELH